MLLYDKRQIGDRLLLRRKQLGMTQEEVAEAAGLSGRTYADIERGNANMRLETALQICAALRIKPNDILITGEANSEIALDELFDRVRRCAAPEQATAKRLLEVYLDSVQQ